MVKRWVKNGVNLNSGMHLERLQLANGGKMDSWWGMGFLVEIGFLVEMGS